MSMVQPDTSPGGPRNAWLTVTDEKPFKALHDALEWRPFLHVGDGYKAIGYRREDSIGYAIPNVDHSTLQADGSWWATWAHPMMCGRPGWRHHALGSYASREAAAMAFDKVYDLERIAGNVDRCPCLKAPPTTETGISDGKN